MATYSKKELQTLDALVTQFVMDYPVYTNAAVEAARQGQPTLIPPTTSLAKLQRPAPWTCDQSLAMSVVAHLLKQGFKVKMLGEEAGWQVAFIIGHVEHQAFATKLSVAICIASLFAVGINPFRRKNLS